MASSDKPLNPTPLTRRGFLKVLGAVGGASVMYGAMNAWGLARASAQDHPPELSGSGEGRRVIILGAGLAGMTAAYELGRLGYACTILEARGFAGGRCQTARRGFELTEAGGERQVCDFDEGLYYNHGPWRIPYHHRSVLHYCKEFGVRLEGFINENDGAYVYRENVDGPLSGERLRLREVKADMGGYIAELLAKAIDQDALDVPLSQEDKDRLVDQLVAQGYLARPELAYRGTGNRGYRVDPGAGITPGPGETSDPYDFAALLQAGVGAYVRSVPGYTMQMSMLQPVGGMDRIARGFEEAVGDSIQYESEIREIRQSEDGVRIVYQDLNAGSAEEIAGDFCLSTLPLSVMIQIPSDLSGDMQRAMRGVAYQATTKIGLQFARRFWEEDDFIYGGHSYTNLPIGNVSYPSGEFLAQKGVLQGCYNFGTGAIETSNLDLRGRAMFALEHGAKVHPQMTDEYETSFSAAWHRVRYSLGGWASYSADARREAYPRLNEPDGRIYLAGEHLSYLTGWMAGAVESAWQQLGRIHAHAQEEAKREGKLA